MSLAKKFRKKLGSALRQRTTEPDGNQAIHRPKKLPPLFPHPSEKGSISQIQAGKFERIRRKPSQLEELEYGLFSQFGEDGIIEFLVDQVPVANQWFVEFGVDNYVESNTRLLLLRDFWKGLVFDGSQENIDSITNRPDFWRVNLRAEASFITKHNIAERIERSGFGGRPGLLSIDIDGNDYWVWEALSGLRPWVAVCEYNTGFGSDADITVPYRPDFVRSAAHPSNQYFGASLSALVRLGGSIGMRFVGVNRAGNNAFFVDSKLPLDLPTLSARDGYRRASFRESRDSNGSLDFREDLPQEADFQNLPVYDFRRGCEVVIREALDNPRQD